MCDTRNFAVNLYNGVSYLKSNYPAGEGFLPAEHVTYSQNSGPWFLNEALQNHAHADSIDTADKVYVHDFCFIMWWVSYMHSSMSVYGGNEHAWPLDSYPGGELVTLYHSLIQHPRWKKNNGADFVFFWPHAGISGGPAMGDYWQLACEAFGEATFVVIERMQRFQCSDYRQGKVIVAPYSSNSKYQNCPIVALPEKKLVFYKGRCTPPTEFGSEGIALRHEVVSALPIRQDITVDCSDRHDNSFEFQSHSALLEDMSQHRFCLVIAGDTSSSRRLTDSMLAKCIPVFIGPPFHTLPLTDVVDYASFGLFLNVTSKSTFLTGQQKGQPSDYMWQLDTTRPHPVSASQSEWWVPDGDWHASAIAVEAFTDILPTLESVQGDDLTSRQASLERFSPYFRYSSDYPAGHSATKAVIDSICSS